MLFPEPAGKAMDQLMTKAGQEGGRTIATDP
jgi:hypothetical protein